VLHKKLIFVKKYMAVFDLMQGNKTKDVWEELELMGFTKKNASEWFTQRYDNEEFKEKKDQLLKLPDSIVIRGEGITLVGLQKDLEDRGVLPQTKTTHDNVFYNHMIIHHFREKIDEDVSPEIVSPEPSNPPPEDTPTA
jgi:hypothetical protein